MKSNEFQKVAMSIAGSDSGGGAGIQADLKTFQELGVYGTTVITALTAQNTLGVDDILPIPKHFVESQIKSVIDDFKVDAIKTGMLFSSDIIKSVAISLKSSNSPLVIDPVMVAKSGDELLQKKAIDALIQYLLPICTIITPNIPEAQILTKRKIKTYDDCKKAAMILKNMGAKNIIIKGGHKDGDESIDEVFLNDGSNFSMISKKINTKNTHGTGCTFSAAITAFLANSLEVKSAIINAKKFIQLAIFYDLHLGNGNGPTNHGAYKKFINDSHKECEIKILER